MEQWESHRTGWMSPDAELEQCPTYGHTSKAAEICERLKIYYAPHKEDSTLMSHGWIKIMYVEFMEYGYRFFGGWRRTCTEAQKQSLRAFLDKWAIFVAPSGFGDLYELGVITNEERIEKPWILLNSEICHGAYAANAGLWTGSSRPGRRKSRSPDR